MKVIELLNKIANGEEVPKKIKFRNDIFRYTGCSYYCDEMHTTFFNIYNFAVLNEKVEIIEEEEDKKIKKVSECFTSTDNKEIQFLIDNINQLGNKINEIIDKINEMEDK